MLDLLNLTRPIHFQLKYLIIHKSSPLCLHRIRRAISTFHSSQRYGMKIGNSATFAQQIFPLDRDHDPNAYLIADARVFSHTIIPRQSGLD